MGEQNEIVFKVVVEDEELASELMRELNNLNDYVAKPDRGTIVDVVVQTVQTIHDNKDFLQTLFELATPALTYFIEKHKAADRGLKVSMEIDGKSIEVEGRDIEQVTRLVEKFEKAYPEETKKVSSKSKIKFKAYKR